MEKVPTVMSFSCRICSMITYGPDIYQKPFPGWMRWRNTVKLVLYSADPGDVRNFKTNDIFLIFAGHNDIMGLNLKRVVTGGFMSKQVMFYMKNVLLFFSITQDVKDSKLRSFCLKTAN